MLRTFVIMARRFSYSLDDTIFPVICRKHKYDFNSFLKDNYSSLLLLHWKLCENSSLT
jgi:hypothetical protein